MDAENLIDLIPMPYNGVVVIKNKERIFYLDFIRAISVVLIVIFHFNSAMSSHGSYFLFQNYANGNLGTIGVSLFFIISGAALMYSYHESFSIKDFFYKRFLAIYPMFWTAYALAFLYSFYVSKGIESSAPKVNFLLTIIGMDGYLNYWIQGFYLIGEWFLGSIILLYFCFPLLRKFIIEKPKVLFICASILYIVIVETYSFKMSIGRNFITRIPDLLVGMYFIRYLKNVKLYQFLIALFVTMVIIFVKLNTKQMYEITIIGISSFFVLVYVAQHIKLKVVKSLFSVVSKYSFAIFLSHHIVIYQIANRFKGVKINTTETYILFLSTCIIIAVISVYLYKISDKLSRYIKKY